MEEVGLSLQTALSTGGSGCRVRVFGSGETEESSKKV